MLIAVQLKQSHQIEKTFTKHVVALFTRDIRERKALPLSFGDVRVKIASARAFPLLPFEPKSSCFQDRRTSSVLPDFICRFGFAVQSASLFYHIIPVGADLS